MLGERLAAATVDLETRATGIGRADFEAGGEDDAIHLVLDPVEHEPLLGDAIDTASALVSTSVTFGRLNDGRYSSLKVGRLQN